MFCTLPHLSKEVYTAGMNSWSLDSIILGRELKEIFLTGLPSSIIGAGTTHHVRTFTTKHVDQFLTTNVVISDIPDGHIFTKIYPQLQWCLWIFSLFIYPCTRGKSTCYTFLYSVCILLPSYWWHKLIINILNLFYVLMWWTFTTSFIQGIFKISHMYLF
jgi:hypothetical protein